MASRRMPLSLLGTLFYLAPTGSFLTGVAVYNEAFSLIHVIAFLLIWSGLGIYLWAGRAKQ
jgi:chloramphenicol-sensitive protein RarD